MGDSGNTVIKTNISRVTIENYGNVIKEYDIGVSDNGCFISEVFILQYFNGVRGFPQLLNVECGNTTGRITMKYAGTCRAPPIRDTALYIRALEILAYMHGHGIVHCDIKPDNVMIDLGGEVTFIDFSHSYPICTASRAVCDKNMIMLPQYSAPEFNKRATYTTSSDIWALGCLFYEWYTGKALFRGDKERVLAMQYDSLATTTAITRNVDDPFISNLIQMMLILDPGMRLSADMLLSYLLDRKIVHLDEPSILTKPNIDAIILEFRDRFAIITGRLTGLSPGCCDDLSYYLAESLFRDRWFMMMPTISTNSWYCKHICTVVRAIANIGALFAAGDK